MELLDSHAHYNDEQFKSDVDEVIKRVYNSGVTTIINAGYDLNGSRKAIEIARKYNFMYATVGVSPNDLEDLPEDYLKQVKLMGKDHKVVAIGEIGLDYHYGNEDKPLQKKVFIEQIELANELNLPIVIHTRDATLDTIQILKENECKNRGVIHCCELNEELVKEVLKLGFYTSFAGPVTYLNSTHNKKVLDLIPIDRILTETDSPYLSPEPVRGTRNDSGNIKYIAQKVADLKNITIEELTKQININAKSIFKI